MYWLNSKVVPRWFVLFVFSFYYVSAMLGYSSGFFLEKREISNSIKLLKIGLIFLFVFVLLTFKRLFYIGTISDFENNTLVPLIKIPSLFFIVFGGILIAIFVLVAILYHFGKELDKKWDKDDQSKIDKKRKIVSLYKVKDGIKNAIINSLNYWDGINYIKNLLEERDHKVIIKPNFCGGSKDKIGTQTSPEVLSAVIDILKEIDENVKITIVESGSIYWWNLEPLLKKSVYQKLFKEKNADFVNLSK